MKSKILTMLFVVVQILTLSACIFQHAGPDPKVPLPSRVEELTPTLVLGRLIKAESQQLLDMLGTYRHQEYNYDEKGRLISVYAPDDYLPCVSEIPYTWLLFTHSNVIEERYEYDERDMLVRVTGYLPAELTDNRLGYEITLVYDESGHVVQESLSDSSGEYFVSLEYNGDHVQRVVSSDGRVAELYYENGDLVRTVLPDGEITYSREPGEILLPTDTGARYIDGYTVTISCSGPRVYTEKADYTEDGKLISRIRNYEDDPQNVYYWHYTYS